MGAHLWFYFVNYEEDISRALQALRRREFQAGRYNPVIAFPFFPIEASPFPSPGGQHASIEEALQAADADGTRSILDIQTIGDTPGYGVATSLSCEELVNVFGTTQPTRKMIEQNLDFCSDLERGHGIYIIVFDKGTPSEIFFAGYSYD